MAGKVRHVGQHLTHLLRRHAEPLRELINISQLELVADENTEVSSYTVSKAKGAKCTRCWRWEESVGQHETQPEICERCVDAVG